MQCIIVLEEIGSNEELNRLYFICTKKVHEIFSMSYGVVLHSMIVSHVGATYRDVHNFSRFVISTWCKVTIVY